MQKKLIQIKSINYKIMLVMIISIIFNLFIPLVYATSLPTFAIVESKKEEASKNNNQKDNSEKKVYKTNESSIKSVANVNFNFQSKSQILMESTTGEILYANNENERLLPASVTKVMTLLLIMEAIDSGRISYNDKVTCSLNASRMGGSQIWFKEGEQLTIEEALKCICVVSANDVSLAMAELISGTEENFVNMMNTKAKELGMTNTNFMNSHGIDEENHYTSAKDIAIMSRELIMRHPNILKYTSIWMDTIRNGQFGLSNTNKLLKTYSGINGLKTGSTSQALFNLSATAMKNSMTLIAVVLRAPTGNIRSEEITQLLNYGFANYSVKILSKAGETADKVEINKYIEQKVNIIYQNDESLVLEKGKDVEYTKEIKMNDNIVAPIKAGTIVGVAKFMNVNKEVIKEANLTISKDIEKSNLVEYFIKIIKTYGISALKESV